MLMGAASMDKATCEGSLDIALQNQLRPKQTLTVQGASQPPNWVVEMDRSG